MPRALITGGAGYIGSHVNIAMAEGGWETVVFDNLSTGFQDLVVTGEFVRGDILSKDDLESILEKGKFDIVVHLAGKSIVLESIKNPSEYWRTNVVGARTLLDAMRKFGPRKIVFSSSASVYGNPVRLPIDETHPLSPMNPYGKTKLAIEWMLEDEGITKGLEYAILRYFNAAGADPHGRVGLKIPRASTLIPVMFDVALGKRKELEIYGNDYETVDGTCVRDYIHPTDLAMGHFLVANRLLDNNGSIILNLGCGVGYTVLETLRSVEKEIGMKLPIRFVSRRSGDPTASIADHRKALDLLGWKTEYSDIDAIVHTGWVWHKKVFG